MIFPNRFSIYSRAFELYAATNSPEKARLCLDALRRVNKAGRLGRSLKPYEQQLEASKAAAAPCPPPSKTTEPAKDPTRHGRVNRRPSSNRHNLFPGLKKAGP